MSDQTGRDVEADEQLKQETAAPWSIQDARAKLGDLVNRAGFMDERFLVTRNGFVTAAIIGIKDLERLRALDRTRPVTRSRKRSLDAVGA